MGAGMGSGPQPVWRPAGHQRPDRGGRRRAPGLRPALRRPLRPRDRPSPGDRRRDGPAPVRAACPTVVCDDAGRPTGLLLEAAAMDLVQDHVPLDPVPVRAAQLRDLLQDMASTGLTGGHVMDLLGDSQAVVAAAEDLGELPLRLRFAPWCVPGVDGDGIAEFVDLQRRGGRRWAVGAVKFMIDGTIDNGTAWLEQPDALGESTESFWPEPAEYTAAVRALAAHGIATATHAIGDAAVRHVLDAPGGPAAHPGRPASHRAHRDAAHRPGRPLPPAGGHGEHAAHARCTSPGPTTPTTGPRGSAASAPTVPGAAATSATPACRWSSGRTGRSRRSTLGTCSRTHSCAGQRASRRWPRCSRPRG